MSTAAELRSQTAKALAVHAKQKGVLGWHAMRKEELVAALVKVARSERAKAARRRSKNGVAKSPSNQECQAKRKAPISKSTVKAPVEKRLEEIRARTVQSKDLAYVTGGGSNGRQQDRLVVMVRDPYWLHAYWELTQQSVERARVALGRNWHAAKPILRLLEVGQDTTTSTARRHVRDIEIHGGVKNWYVDVVDPPKSYQLDIGYLAASGRFLCLARSNTVTTPQTDTVDGNWEEVAQDFDRIFALSGGYEKRGDNADLKNLFEERLRRPMGSPMVTRYGLGAGGTANGRRSFNFDVDAELIVYGVASPETHITLKGEPVRLQSDGTFTVRFNLPNRRQVLPVVASSPDGVEQQTIILAVERNTKRMEPIIREPDA